MKTPRQRFEKQSDVGRAGQQFLHVNVAPLDGSARAARTKTGRICKGLCYYTVQQQQVYNFKVRKTYFCVPAPSLPTMWFWRRSFHFLRFKFPLHLWQGNNKYFPWLTCGKYDNDPTGIQWTAKQYTDIGYSFYGYTCVIVTMDIKAEQPAFALPSRTKQCYCFPAD